MTDQPTLADWRCVFEQRDICPWPGPRPLRRGDSGLLVGRDNDRLRFLQDVLAHRLILLSGPSGVGKSSLIDTGLIPALERERHVVAVCRDYVGEIPVGGSAAFLAAKIHDQFIAAIPDLPEGSAMFPVLNERLGGRGVIVLDQFEELIRYSARDKERLFDLIVGLNHRYDTKVIVSFRSEYIHELRVLESGARPYTLSNFILDDVDPAHAPAVVLSGKVSESVPDRADDIECGSSVMSTEVAELVAGQWRRAVDATSQTSLVDPFGRAGLLHLQAMLYTLWHVANRDPKRRACPERERIDQSFVKRVLSDLAIAAAAGSPVRPEIVGHDTGVAPEVELLDAPAAFRGALLAAITIKLEHCSGAATEVGVDPFLREGALAVLVRAVGHLSSAGYKLIREVSDLADNALAADLASLLPMSGVGSAETSALLRVLLRSIAGADDALDLVCASRKALAAAVDDELADGASMWSDRLRDRGTPPAWEADPGEVTCGPMFGLHADEVLVEEYRRFGFALAWLQDASLARITTPGTGGARVSLIHDGFGRALTTWRRSWDGSPDEAKYAITAPRGASFAWFDEVVGGRSTPLVLVNLRWKGGWVATSFSNVVFVNCDFRGAMLERCRFVGVSFVNCLLDGVILSDCEIVGSEADQEHWSTDDAGAPRYEVTADHDYVESVAMLRGTSAPTASFFSDLPGSPAIPFDGQTQADLLVPSIAGMSINGGRLSTLVVRGCRFIDGGRISFRRTIGSGLELVEMRSGRFEFFGSAIRHIAFSPPMLATAVTDTAPGRSDGIELRAVGSLLAQTWIAAGIEGAATFENCNVFEFVNAGIVTFAVDDLTRIEGLLGVPTLGSPMPDEALVRDVGQTDYRRNPAREAALADAERSSRSGEND